MDLTVLGSRALRPKCRSDNHEELTWTSSGDDKNFKGFAGSSFTECQSSDRDYRNSGLDTVADAPHGYDCDVDVAVSLAHRRAAGV